MKASVGIYQKLQNQSRVVYDGYVDRKVFILFTAIILLVLSVFAYKHLQDNICANSISCVKDLSGGYKPSTSAVFLGRQIDVPKEALDREVAVGGLSAVLGDKTLPKKIEVDLTSQHMYVFEGDQVVMDFPISSGKWYPTPTGTFRIWVKLRYTGMSGGSQTAGTYYNLPNVPYVMFYSNNEISKSRGFSLHGTYWHNNFGHPMSHGCVNMKTEDAMKLYYWTNPPVSGNTTYVKGDEGTEITIYGEAPEE